MRPGTVKGVSGDYYGGRPDGGGYPGGGGGYPGGYPGEQYGQQGQDPYRQQPGDGAPYGGPQHGGQQYGGPQHSGPQQGGPPHGGQQGYGAQPGGYPGGQGGQSGQGGQGGQGGQQGSQGDGAYPGGPLSLPDETSLYIYGQVPDGYTQVTPQVGQPGGGQSSTVYRGGQPYQPAPPVYAPPARRLTWQEVLQGLISRPMATLDAARDQAFWWSALAIAAIGGMLAMVANDKARDQVLTSTLSTSVPALLMTALLVPAFCAVLGWVSNMLAQTFGGNGEAGPFITLAMLVTWLTDAPRLVVALFARDGSPLVVGVGLLSFVLTAWLLAATARSVHELPWPRAFGAVSVQLIALLLVLKLPIAG